MKSLFGIRDSDIHKVIIATSRYALNTLRESSEKNVYSFFKNELQEIYNKYGKQFSFDELYFKYALIYNITKFIRILKSRMDELRDDILNFSKSWSIFLSPTKRKVKSHYDEEDTLEWKEILQKAYDYLDSNEVTPKLTKIDKILTSSQFGGRDKYKNKQEQLNHINCDVIYDISSLLLDTLTYLMVQYETHGDPRLRTNDISIEELDKLDIYEKWEWVLKEQELVSIFKIEQITINLIINLILTIGTILYPKVTIRKHHAISDVITIIMLAVAVYGNIIMEHQKKHANKKNYILYDVIYATNRSLTYNFLDMLLIFVSIYEQCKIPKVKCIEDALIMKVYLDVSKYHHISMILTAYTA